MYALSGIMIGMILFQTSIVAPSVFKSLDLANAGLFLRSVFPKLFVTLSITGGFFLLLSLIKPLSIFSLSVGIISTGCPLICYLIVPATNQAKDDGDLAKFKKYHTASVLLTLLVLLINGIAIFY